MDKKFIKVVKQLIKDSNHEGAVLKGDNVIEDYYETIKELCDFQYLKYVVKELKDNDIASTSWADNTIYYLYINKNKAEAFLRKIKEDKRDKIIKGYLPLIISVLSLVISILTYLYK